MNKQIKLEEARCTQLSLSAPVALLEEDKNEGNFLIEAYTGETVERWWGWLAIDLEGIKAKKKIPILLNHRTDQIVGYSTNTYTDMSFFVSGKFSEATDFAREVKALANEGFPWQASIGVRPLKILSIEKGSKHKVNGKNLSGPAEVWLESEVFETSFVPLGADDNTSVVTFSKFEETPQGVNINRKKEENSMDITLERLEKDAPTLLAEIKKTANDEGKKEGLAEGEKIGTKRVLELAKVHFKDGEKFETLVNSGITIEQYNAMKDLQPETDDLKAKILAELEEDQVGDPGTGGESSGPKDFMSAWKAIKKEEGCTAREAMSKAAKTFPDLYKKHSGGK